jgi:SAM-dependent methyltransferase
MTAEPWGELRGFFDAKARDGKSDAEVAVHLKGAPGDSSGEIYEALARDADELLQLTTADSLLDIGCGPGALLQRLAPKAREARGIDISAAMVELTRAKGLAADHYDGGRLPYADGCFDAVLMLAVILNIAQRALVIQVLDEAIRVAKPGGRLLVADNFHPVVSNLAPHARPEPPRGWRRALGLGAAPANPVGTYATGYDVFGEVMARHPIVDVRFIWQRNDYPRVANRASGRYHALLKKAAPGDVRAR